MGQLGKPFTSNLMASPEVQPGSKTEHLKERSIQDGPGKGLYIPAGEQVEFVNGN